MLKQLKINNFKAWECADLKCGAITGLFGTNSSGKTSLIQFLLMLKQTKDNADRSMDLYFGDEISLVDLGHFENVVHKHDKSKEIAWELQWQLPKVLAISDPEKERTSKLFEGDSMSIKTSVKEKRGAPSTSHMTYGFDNALFSLETSNQEKATEYGLKYYNGTQFKFRRTLGRNWKLPGPIQSYAFPDQAKTYYQNSGFLSYFESAYEKFMDSIYYLGPLREYPKRQYPWSGSRPLDVGQRGENVIDAILAANAQGERQNLKKMGELNHLMPLLAIGLKSWGLFMIFP